MEASNESIEPSAASLTAEPITIVISSKSNESKISV